MAPVKSSDHVMRQQGGYDVKLCDVNALRRYRCPFCKQLIRNPVQSERGELACEGCYNEAKKNDGRCPIDGEPLEAEAFRDKGKENDIMQLQCLCYYDCCAWKGELRQLESHVDECEYKPINCKLCHKEFPGAFLSGHLEKCPELLTDGCIVKGCTFKPATVSQLKEHLQKDILEHMYHQRSTVIEIQNKMDAQSSLFEKMMKAKNSEREFELAAMKIQIEEVSNMLKTISEKQDDNTEMSSLEERIRRIEISKKATKSTLETDSCKKTPNQDVEKLSNEILLINKNVSDVDLRLQLFENTSYDGRLFWKIDNIEARVEQAISGKITALHSAPVFTDHYQYKFCARLYLNGDGIGKNKYVSLFFVLMRSEYDGLLTWPFSFPVKFKLLNQNGGKHKEERFVPDKRSTSFARPNKDMNIAAGCPCFINLDDFKKGGFIKDDSIFIEVTTEKH